MCMNCGLRRLAELGVRPTQIRATGGGAKSRVWRQIMADIFNAEVMTLEVSEAAAYGAALQALWCWKKQKGEKVEIAEITDEFVKLKVDETSMPNTKNVAIYRDLQDLQNETSKALRQAFSRHQKLVLDLEQVDSGPTCRGSLR